MAVLAVLGAPAGAQDAAPAYASSGDGAASIQAYGDQTANYYTGCVQIDSHETGTIEKVEVTSTGQYTDLGSGPTGNPGPAGGTELHQGKFEVNTVTTKSASEYTSVLKATNFVGHADMTSVGGMSLCGAAGVSAEGSLYQSQTLNQNTSGALAPGVEGSASYTGTQTFSATIRSQK